MRIGVRGLGLWLGRRMRGLGFGCGDWDEDGKTLVGGSRARRWQREGEAAAALQDFSLARTFFGSMLRKTSASATKLSLVRAELGLGICDGPLRTTLQVGAREGAGAGIPRSQHKARAGEEWGVRAYVRADHVLEAAVPSACVC
eukprot:4431901-Prymnesium_polylepis.2